MAYEYYYKIINLIDEIALEKRKPTTEEIKQLDEWKGKDEGLNGECDIADIADANDACAETWEELVEEFVKLWANGDRVKGGQIMEIYTVYATADDMTFIMEEKEINDKEKTLTAIGWYYGKPNDEATKAMSYKGLTATLSCETEITYSKYEDKAKELINNQYYSVPQVIGFIHDLYQDGMIDEPEEEYLYDLVDPEEKYNDCYEYWCAWPYDNPLLKN